MAKNKKAGRRAGPGKPQGMNYAQVLARKAAIQKGLEQAARDATVQVEADTHTQRAMWLMVCSIADAYGFGPERMQKFFAALQANTDELERMRAEVDEEYAFEKLRQKASAVTGMEVHYLYEQTALLEEMQKARQGTCISSELRNMIRRSGPLPGGADPPGLLCFDRGPSLDGWAPGRGPEHFRKATKMGGCNYAHNDGLPENNAGAEEAPCGDRLSGLLRLRP